MTHSASAFNARTLLFVPGHRAERFDKAMLSGADAICIDLEDAVPPERKAEARRAALDHLDRSSGNVRVCLRINGLRTAEGLRDLLALAGSANAPAAVLLPKTEDAGELRLASAVCGRGRQRWLPLIESAAGLHRLAVIAQSAPDLAALMFGGADYSSDIGCAFTWEALLHARQQIVCAAALARVPAIDVPYLDIADAEGLLTETTRAAALGFSAKAAIHPAQVATIQAAFVPNEEEAARARRIVEAAQTTQGGAIVVDGRMVDAPVLAAAHRVLERVRT